MTMFQSFFIFDQKYYKEFNVVVMDFPLGVTLANAFMCILKKSYYIIGQLSLNL